MRKLLVVLVVGGLGILYLRQRHTDNREPAEVQSPTVIQAQVAASSATPVPATTWPKRSIDRARDVATQEREHLKADVNP